MLRGTRISSTDASKRWITREWNGEISYQGLLGEQVITQRVHLESVARVAENPGQLGVVRADMVQQDFKQLR